MLTHPLESSGDAAILALPFWPSPDILERMLRILLNPSGDPAILALPGYFEKGFHSW